MSYVTMLCWLFSVSMLICFGLYVEYTPAFAVGGKLSFFPLFLSLSLSLSLSLYLSFFACTGVSPTHPPLSAKRIQFHHTIEGALHRGTSNSGWWVLVVVVFMVDISNVFVLGSGIKMSPLRLSVINWFCRMFMVVNVIEFKRMEASQVIT